jgi:dephospho-CoA kinase
LVTAPPEIQRARVLARPGMTEAQFQFLHSLQIADREKRKLADHIVETLSIESTRAFVLALIQFLRSSRA